MLSYLFFVDLHHLRVIVLTVFDCWERHYMIIKCCCWYTCDRTFPLWHPPTLYTAPRTAPCWIFHKYTLIYYFPIAIIFLSKLPILLEYGQLMAVAGCKCNNISWDLLWKVSVSVGRRCRRRRRRKSLSRYIYHGSAADSSRNDTPPRLQSMQHDSNVADADDTSAVGHWHCFAICDLPWWSMVHKTWTWTMDVRPWFCCCRLFWRELWP